MKKLYDLMNVVAKDYNLNWLLILKTSTLITHNELKSDSEQETHSLSITQNCDKTQMQMILAYALINETACEDMTNLSFEYSQHISNSSSNIIILKSISLILIDYWAFIELIKHADVAKVVTYLNSKLIQYHSSPNNDMKILSVRVRLARLDMLDSIEEIESEVYDKLQKFSRHEPSKEALASLYNSFLLPLEAEAKEDALYLKIPGPVNQPLKIA